MVVSDRSLISVATDCAEYRAMTIDHSHIDDEEARGRKSERKACTVRRMHPRAALPDPATADERNGKVSMLPNTTARIDCSQNVLNSMYISWSFRFVDRQL